MSSSPSRRLPLALLVFALPLAPVAACVHPDKDMDDYLNRSQAQRDEHKPKESDASVATDAGGFSGDYFMVCLSPLSDGDINKTLRFKASVDFRPTAPSTGPISILLQPLDSKATTVDSPIGPSFPVEARRTSQVTAGRFVFDVGDTPPDLPKEANALTGLSWSIVRLVLRGVLTNPPQSFCARLEGETRPSGIDAAGTVCLFELPPPKGSDAGVTIPPKEAFTCPQ